MKDAKLKINIFHISPENVFLGFTLLFMFTNNNRALYLAHYYNFIVIGIICAVAGIFLRQSTKISMLRKSQLLTNLFLLASCTITLIINISTNEETWILSYGLILTFYWVYSFRVINEVNIRFVETCLILGGVIISYLIIVYRTPYIGSARYTIKFMNNDSIDPNFLSAYLCIPSVLAFYRFMLSSKNNKIYIIAFIMTFAGILFTGSRGALLGLIFGYGFVWLDKMKKQNTLNPGNIFKVLRYLIVFIIAIIVIIQFLPEDIITRLFKSSYQDASGEDRLELWKYALTAISHSPIYGYGFISPQQIIFNISGVNMDVHNTYLSIAINFGVPALISVIYLMLKGLILAIKKHEYSVAGIFVSCMIFSFFINESISLVFWLVLYLGWAKLHLIMDTTKNT